MEKFLKIEYPFREWLVFVADKEVAKILTEVKVTMREAEIKLDETDFDEKKLINKRKKLILQGQDPDQIEKKILQLRKEMKKRKLANRKLIDLSLIHI